MCYSGIEEARPRGSTKDTDMPKSSLFVQSVSRHKNVRIGDICEDGEVANEHIEKKGTNNRKEQKTKTAPPVTSAPDKKGADF